MHLLYDGYYTSFPIKFFLWRPDNLRQLFIATWASQQIPYFLKVWKGFTCAISLNKAKLQQDGIAPLIVYLTERACEAIKHNLAFETFPTKKKMIHRRSIIFSGYEQSKEGMAAGKSELGESCYCNQGRPRGIRKLRLKLQLFPNRVTPFAESPC